MLRNCKDHVVVVGSAFCYNEITKLKGDFMMKLQDKIMEHRKANGWSQEDLADKRKNCSDYETMKVKLLCLHP